MKIMKNKADGAFQLYLYIILLFITAFTRDFGLAPLVARLLGPIALALVEPTWKLIFWITPLLFYLSSRGSKDFLADLGLRLYKGTNLKKAVWWTIGSCAILSGLLFFIPLQLHRTPNWNHTPNDWLNSVLLAGVIEEIIFRGFLFQQILRLLEAHQPPYTMETIEEEESIEQPEEEEGILLPDWLESLFPSRNVLIASTISTAIFVLIHYPNWLETHQSPLLIATTSLFNLLFGYILCVLLRKSESLWPCVILHCLNNFITLVLPN
jgi:membrane protease YdiL (CAAX protease family)